jgi:hypothetical protein
VSARRAPGYRARSRKLQGRSHRAVHSSLAQRPARPLTEDPGPDRRHRTKVRLPVARVAPKEKSVARTLRRRDAADGTFAAPASRMERRRAVSRRRARLVTVVCLGFCGLVLATSFPVSALMRQHRQMAAATSELRSLSAGNESLQKQASVLSDPVRPLTRFCRIRAPHKLPRHRQGTAPSTRVPWLRARLSPKPCSAVACRRRQDPPPVPRECPL